MLALPDAEKSYWREAYPEQIYPQLNDDMEVDVAIIGAGITGLTSAYLLKQAGLKVVVLEKRTVGAGTSGRTTGKVTSQHGITYHDLYDRLGEKTARMYGEANQAAVEQIAAVVKKERMDCDWHSEDNYVFTTDPEKVHMFKQEAKIAAELGLPATFETKTYLPFEVQGAVKFANQGKIHAQKYLMGLAKAVDGKGSHVFESSTAIGIRDGNPGRVRTKKAAVAAKHIIVATNVPTSPLIARGAYCLLEYPTESYAVACAPESRLRGMYISPDKGMYSLLNTKINDRPVLLVVGEGGNLSGFRLHKRRRHQRLADYAEKWFGATSITHRWSDRDYLAYDGMPLVGKMYPWSKHLYVATAFRKWGLSNGTAAAIMLRDMITGAENSWAETFRAVRMTPIKSIPRAVFG